MMFFKKFLLLLLLVVESITDRVKDVSLKVLKLNPNLNYDQAISTNESSYKKMSDCERSLHWNCALQLGTLKNVKVDCNLKDLEKCLSDHKKISICQIEDPDTLYTIDQLQKELRSVATKRKNCKKQDFINKLQDYFKVLGEEAESSHAKVIEYSGNGELNKDSEDDAIVKINSFSEEIHGENFDVISEDLEYWRETAKQISNARKILRGKMIFFEDRKYIVQREEKLSQKEFIAKTWENLIDRYTQWYRSLLNVEQEDKLINSL